jgi:hypothetical protein
MIERFGIKSAMLFPRPHFRRILLFAGVSLLLLGGACCVLVLSQDSGPNLSLDNIRRIREGMSFPEVEEVIGAPPDFSVKDQEASERLSQYITAQGWISDDTEVTVSFDEEGKVVGCRHCLVTVPVLDRLINQAKHQWRLFSQ